MRLWLSSARALGLFFDTDIIKTAITTARAADVITCTRKSSSKLVVLLVLHHVKFNSPHHKASKLLMYRNQHTELINAAFRILKSHCMIMSPYICPHILDLSDHLNISESGFSDDEPSRVGSVMMGQTEHRSTQTTFSIHHCGQVLVLEVAELCSLRKLGLPKNSRGRNKRHHPLVLYSQSLTPFNTPSCSKAHACVYQS